jgi:hypothetical protein
VLERIARFQPDEFAPLEAFPARHRGFPDEALIAFTSEVRL